MEAATRERRTPRRMVSSLAAIGLVAGMLAITASSAGATASPTSPGLALPAQSSFTGRYVLVHSDPNRVLGTEELQFFDVGGHLYELRGVPLNRFPPSAKIAVSGTLSGNTVTATHASQVGPPTAPSTTGPQSLLVIDVVWGSQTITTNQATAQNFVFGTTDTQRRTLTQYYQDVSYGQVSWAGDVTTTLTIADPGSCLLDAIANSADSAATNAGYILSNYGHHMYNFPAQYCGGAWGQVGGVRSWVSNGLWNLDDGYARMGPAHELGHNFGLWHGHGLDCGAGTASQTCISGATGHRCDDGFAAPCVSEYGFSYDLMGNNWTSDNYDAVNWMSLREQTILGWVNGRTLSDIAPASPADHTFTIAPIEKSTGNVGLVITTPNRHYYVEYRQPLSQDTFLTHWPDATTGVLISSDDNADNDTTAFGAVGPLNLDTSPDSCLSDSNCDWHDAALNSGQTFTDVGGAFTLTLDSYSTTGATVTVHWAGGGGDTTPPTITKAPKPALKTTITATQIPVTISWAATDASGICAYELQERVNGGAWTSVSLASPTAKSVSRNETPGSVYQYQARARDCSTNQNWSGFAAGPSFTPSKDEETSSAITYAGNWTRTALTGASGGYVDQSTASGNSTTYSCTCSQIGFVSTKGPGRGSIQVYVDNVLKTTISLTNTTLVTKKVVYKTPVFSSVGAHTLRIVTTSSSIVDADAFINLH